MFLTLLGHWAQGGGGGLGSPNGFIHNLQFFTLRNSKIEVFETSFFATMIT